MNKGDIISKEQYNQLVTEHGYSHWRKVGWQWTEHILNNGYIFSTDKEELEYTFEGIHDGKLEGGFLYSRDKKKSPNYYKTFKK